MNYTEMVKAVHDAEETIRMADIAARKLSPILAGRLKAADVSYTTLCELKKELKDFNMHTGEWK